MGLRRCAVGGPEVSFGSAALYRRFCFLYLLDDGGDQKQKNKSGGQSAALQKKLRPTAQRLSLTSRGQSRVGRAGNVACPDGSMRGSCSG